MLFLPEPAVAGVEAQEINYEKINNSIYSDGGYKRIVCFFDKRKRC